MAAEDGRYATLAELRAWMRRSVAVGGTTDEAEALSKLLKGIELRVDNKTGGLFAPTVRTDIEVHHFGGDILRVPRLQAITSIQFGYDGTAITSSDYALASKDPRANAGWLGIRRTNGYWQTGLYLLDGTFGWNETPEDMSQAVIEQVEFRWNRRTGMQAIAGFDGAITMDGGYAWLTSTYDVIMSYTESSAIVGGVC